VLSVRNVLVQSTIGFNPSGNGNVPIVVLEQLYEAVQSWNPRSYPFTNGIYA